MVPKIEICLKYFSDKNPKKSDIVIWKKINLKYDENLISLATSQVNKVEHCSFLSQCSFALFLVWAPEKRTLWKKSLKPPKIFRKKCQNHLNFIFLIFRFGWSCWRSWCGQTTRINAWHYPHFRTVWYCSPCQRWYFVVIIF